MTNEPAWLDALRADLSAITRPAAALLWPAAAEVGGAFFDYRMEHVMQVEREALRLLSEVRADREVVLAAVWIHDRYQPAFTGERHGERAAEWAMAELVGFGFPADKVGQVAFCVAHHSSKTGLADDAPVEARLLWDADKLAHLGPAELLTALFNNVAADRLDSARNSLLSWMADEGYARLKQPADPERFHFALSRRLARERAAVQETFVRVLALQSGSHG